jgi:ketosteroid isomerase-like protein
VAAALTGAALARLPALAAPGDEPGPRRVVEIRSYNLKPGTRQRYHERLVRDALPLLARSKVDVVSFGPSMHDDNSYFLMRAYPDLAERQKSEDAFYGSDEWKNGIRDAVLADIENYTTIVRPVDETTLRGLRTLGGTTMEQGTIKTEREGSSRTTDTTRDLAALTALNEDYIRSVQHSDVKRFDEILADDFLCSLPDGTLIDRAAFLTQTARPVTISGLQAHDVNVRLMGEFAIIHARTTYRAADGQDHAGRYTDVWARRNGRWLAVSAHVTRN